MFKVNNENTRTTSLTSLKGDFRQLNKASLRHQMVESEDYNSHTMLKNYQARLHGKAVLKSFKASQTYAE